MVENSFHNHMMFCKALTMPSKERQTAPKNSHSKNGIAFGMELI
jgi:hypothetical protein